MDAWLNGMHGVFLRFFGRATPEETYTVIALCVLLGALALSRISTELGARGAFYTTGLLLTALGLALIGAAMAVPPVFGLHLVWMPMAVAGLVLLVLILPLTMLFQKGGYITALIAWIVSLLIIGAILLLEPMMMRLWGKGLEKAHQLEKHRIELESVK